MIGKLLHGLGVAAFLVCATAWTLSMAQTPNGADPNTVNPQPSLGSSLIKFDSGLDVVLAPGAKLEKLSAEGFEGGEGPTWVPEGKAGYLLFSDVPANRIYKWTPATCPNSPCSAEGTLTVFQDHAGFRDASRVGKMDASGRRLAGSNGLAVDRQHRVLIDADGERAVERIEKDGVRTIVADRYDGKRINCPNDIAVKSDGAIYFTDSGAGCLDGGDKSPDKEIAFHGFYVVKDGKVQLLDADPGGFPPNGIAVSPNGKILYVSNAPGAKQIFAYDIQRDDRVKKNPRVLVNFAGEKGLGGPDGVRVNSKGNIYTAATGGVWIIAPDGKRLGKVPAPVGIRFANLAFGDPDGKTLYIVSANNLWRIHVKIRG